MVAIHGTGEAGAKALLNTRSAAELKRLGLTVAKAEKIADYYRGLATTGRGAGAPGARLELMEHIVTTLRGG